MISFNRICFSYPLISMVVLALTGCIIFKSVEAQVTFSKDWGAGKRSTENFDCRAAIKSASALCHLLMNQVSQLSSCVSRHEETFLNYLKKM